MRVVPSKKRYANPGDDNGNWAVVEAPAEKYFGPADKINITVPRLILVRIDDYAKKHGLSRSAFLVESARAAMSQLQRARGLSKATRFARSNKYRTPNKKPGHLCRCRVFY